MKWQSFAFVFQSNDAISRIRETLEAKDRPSYPIMWRELMSLKEMSKLKTDRERENTYIKLVKELQLASQNSLYIDVQSENLDKVLDTMSQMGLMGDYFMALLVGLDSTQKVDMRKYLSKDSVANVTQFRIIRDGPSDASIEAALLYDSVFVLSDAMNLLLKELGPNEARKIRPKPLSCLDKTKKYEVGERLINLIRRRTRMGRRTGPMTFNDKHEREFELEILNTQAGRTTQVGVWNKDGLHISRDEKNMNDSLNEAAKNKVFIVSTRVGSPYITPVPEEAKGRLIGEKKYIGYCIDLIEQIEQHLGIKCQFELVPDGKYGSRNPVTKQWDGLIRRLLDLKADLAICDLTITSERQSAVDFTAPFMNLGISILYSKSEKVVPKLFAFMDPFSVEVWMYTATGYLIVSLMLFWSARWAPEEWVNPHPCNDENEELENNFSMMNSMWLTMGSLMQQGSDILPRATSIRLMTGVYWFFVLIMVSSYTANLAAFLTAVKMEESINDVEDLAKQTKIAYGALKDGSTYSFFKNSNTSLYQRIFNTMAEAKPSVFTKTNDEGVERVIKGRRKYAFFMESTGIEYQVERHCELQQVGALLDNKGYGIAMPPNSPYRTLFSTAILHLQEKGMLQTLKQKWWKDMGGGLCDEESDEPVDSNELSMAHVGGVFLVLIFGCIMSVMLGIIEFLWNARQVAIEEKITPREALINEFKFVIDFSKTCKPVKTSKSSSKSSSSAKSSERNSRSASKRSRSAEAAPPSRRTSGERFEMLELGEGGMSSRTDLASRSGSRVRADVESRASRSRLNADSVSRRSVDARR
ncbi:hypothetical protein QAD02_019874 [Eretmocerus hayati]|uniref:Uncharacterized protein n=1 Tax=Eretmocerus hayati TaxID=131215 RepID=A0ACC2PL21_9HYME|nr:hypothetical protein QAD02_019874 [Eretmocerus hayati]